ncbi:hypothetical protein DSO57_1032361 [Entomophthora muscae]|uniref:Uncharacterized protein n=1 Tax=Entomophthora muscae TaxID=34485 RepID=A0ACC2U9F1_9FUNG|nr:hypothetical protein DSO57_1032361 [Entomophthora muscae]
MEQYMFSKALYLLLNLSLLVAGNQKRIVAVGDIHGDITNAKKVMHMVGATDEKGNWIGGSDLTLVQTGDIIDRGDDTIKLFTWLSNLQNQAKTAGGKFVMLLGNHEIMNLMGDWVDVTEGEKKTFGSIQARKEAFSKDGWIGKFIRKLPVSVIIDGTVFVHGGIKKEYILDGLDAMNKLGSKYINEDTEDELKTRKFFLQDHDSPVWYRDYYVKPESEICGKLKEVLDTLGAQRMVMGHTFTDDQTIEPKCDGMAYFIDVGMSSYYKPWSLFAALQLTKTDATAIYMDKKEKLKFIPSK